VQRSRSEYQTARSTIGGDLPPRLKHKYVPFPSPREWFRHRVISRGCYLIPQEGVRLALMFRWLDFETIDQPIGTSNSPSLTDRIPISVM